MDKQERFWKIGLRTFVLAAVLLVLVGLLAGTDINLSGNGDEKKASATPAGISINVLATGKACDRKAVATQAMVDVGWKPGTFIVGSPINWDAAEANERGSGAFVTKTPRTAQAVVDELGADTPKAKAAKEGLMKTYRLTEAQVLNPGIYIPVQTQEAAKSKNSRYADGKAVPAGIRNSDAGDVWWLIVPQGPCEQATRGEIPAKDAVGAHRAGCGNPQFGLPVPANPTPPQPTTPGTTTPTTPTTQPPQPKCFINGIPIYDGRYCGSPDDGNDYLDPRLPPSNPNVDVRPDPPPTTAPPATTAPPQQPGPGPVVVKPPTTQPVTPPTTKPPVGDPCAVVPKPDGCP